MTDTKKNQKIIDNYDYLLNAASSMECTGLIPFLPTDDAQLESYNELYRYQSSTAACQCLHKKLPSNSPTQKRASSGSSSIHD